MIKVYNPELLISNASDKLTQLVRDDFKPFILRCEQHKLCVLENENLILFSLLFDKCQPIIDEAQLTITFVNQKDQSKIIAIKFADKKTMSYLQHNINSRKTYTQYMGPLAYQPVRKERTSLLSTESPEQNFRGILNLGILILIANHIRLIFENFQKYGLLITNVFWKFEMMNINGNPIMQALLILMINLFIGFGIQYLQFKRNLSTGIIRTFNITNIVLTIIIPCYLIQGSHPGLNLILLGVQFIAFMKLISYAHFMRNTYFYIQRIKQVKNKKVPLDNFFAEYEVNAENLKILEKYSQDQSLILDFKHFLYFLAAPTLCFQLSYLRTQSIRKVWLIKRIIEYIFVILFLVIIWFQYTEPLVENTYKMLSKSPSLMVLADRLLKLAIPNTYMWMALFYGQFQCFLNITAELLRFADREFYKEWWNCKNLEEYWRLWNLPVHHWLVRHVYFPCLKSGMNRTISNMIVFLVSALGHEYIVSASIGVVEAWAFVGMFAQAPFMLLQKKLEKILKLQDSQLGNLMFWMTFCFIGQPIMIFVYYFRYLQKIGHPI
ncbi:unnamed protein product (macronuclear) [Paramecium tetraurelia]|uniref:diacylglycerol O-acyltransferase n=1 Tax=Paramecium tetraurelia TaxID=5888 RepID=A0D3E1_PARTE|nr:uncharacterized protein GSPATT00013044001 [Paramecium tetraurelia]CAK77558.1 unnamed protein product [Paramecium tetraurelia]|eukprot:XP_001444955.1 hypothetical protein (macronuclear) [Paramecium tetraurelia strain d4-2]